MHECPYCGMACDCDGEDLWGYAPDDCQCECDDLEDECGDCWDDDDDYEEMFLDCGTPGCIMQGYHFLHDCHTAKDLEAHYADEYARFDEQYDHDREWLRHLARSGRSLPSKLN